MVLLGSWLKFYLCCWQFVIDDACKHWLCSVTKKAHMKDVEAISQTSLLEKAHEPFERNWICSKESNYTISHIKPTRNWIRSSWLSFYFVELFNWNDQELLPKNQLLIIAINSVTFSMSVVIQNLSQSVITRLKLRKMQVAGFASLLSTERARNSINFVSPSYQQNFHQFLSHFSRLDN